MRLMRLFELVKKCSLAIGSNRSFFRNFCNKKLRLMRFERMTYPLKGRTPKRMQGVVELARRTLCCVLPAKHLFLEGLYLLSSLELYVLQ